MDLKNIVVVVIALMFVKQASGQSFPQYWVFDRFMGIRFDQDSSYSFVSPCWMYPTGFIPGNSSFIENGACITVDSNRYFYAGGDQIFNWKGNVLTNGTNIFTEPYPNFSEINGTLLLPVPNHEDSLFFWLNIISAWANYSNGAQTNGNYGLKYSVFNTNINNGEGEVLNSKKEIFIKKEQLSERLAAIRQANGKDWWILVQKFPSGTFLIYRTCDDSIVFEKEYSNSVLSFSSGGSLKGVGEWDYNPNTNIFSYLLVDSKLFLFDFNICTGDLELLKEHSFNDTPFGCYGFSVSPKMKYGYFATETNELFQFAIDSLYNISTPVRILNCDTLPCDLIYPCGAVQLENGPDGSIYIAYSTYLSNFSDTLKFGTIGRISNPDLPFPNCEVKWNYFVDSNWTVRAGLPNLPVDIPWAGLQPGNITASQDSGCYPLSVAFSHNSCGQLGQIWDFGDGTVPDSSETPTHVYDQPGAYSVTLTLWHEDTSAVVTYPVTLFADDCVQAGFTADTVSGCYELSVDFSPQASGNAEWYFWDFGDGTVSDTIFVDSTATHLYDEAGSYSVSLIVGNGFKSDTLRRTDYVTVSDCGDFFQVYPNPSDGYFTVEYHLSGDEPFKGEVWGMWGRKLTELDFQPGYFKGELDLSMLASAMYVLRVELPGGTVRVIKLVVERF